MDGFDGSSNVVVIAASNLLDKLDGALLRPGRFDRQILVTPAGVVGRRRILEVHTKNKPLGPSVDLDMIARQTSGLSGADLANICNEAAIFAARRDAELIGHKDFDTALERIVAGMATHRRLSPHERRVVAYHEAGHALCGELLPAVDPVHKISIIPRGRALGYTLNLPEEDRYLKTREELEDHLVMLLGGRAAERVVFGAVTTGASDDLKRVAEVAKAMITEYAMGDSFFSLQVSGENASDKLLRRRDDEIQAMADTAYQRALEIMVGYRIRLEKLAEELIEHEVLERPAIDRIMEGVEEPRTRHPVAELGVAAMSPPPDGSAAP
jgi:cell division protease FtsH